MRISKPWVLLFSRTGLEAADLLLRIRPDKTRVYTTRKEPSPHFPNPRSEYAPFHVKPEQINKALQVVKEPTLVTLHGYMRILPAEVIQNPNLIILNSHPGDILDFPELKGKDPQKKALELGLDHTGVVIHRVTEDLDAGPVIKVSRLLINKNEDEQSLSNRLRLLSIQLWLQVLKEQLHYKVHKV